ncbi:MAG TPA: radical SAM protein, partial [Verrucomicrobiae bacterium]|nr:radical SAM protein [Verrucomicrobiae bacterium]
CEVGTLAGVAELLNQGADHVSIALDAACERVFADNKGGSWPKKYNLLAEAAKEFPGRIATHLIVGLGETEEEMVKTIQDLHNRGIIIALFAFTPVKGTRLEKAAQPEIGHYRRIQAARYLITQGLTGYNKMQFAGGRISGLGLGPEKLRELLGDGEAFRTSGCPDCNRPYYNEKPGGVIYNYPQPLTAAQKEQALEEVSLGIGPDSL